MLKFGVAEYLERHPLQKKMAVWWIGRQWPVPERIKRQMANQIHAEMIARLMDVVVRDGALTMEKALKVHFEIGREIADQTRQVLAIDPNSAESLARIIDFLHDILDIGEKKTLTANPGEAISRWSRCPLSNRLKELKDTGGPYYCHLSQEMYKGVLYAINPLARANDLLVTQSQGHAHCELKTWIENPGQSHPS